MLESVIKLFDSVLNLFGLDVNPVSGQVDQTFFVVYTDEEKVDCCKYKPMTSFVRVRAETQPYFTGVAETPVVCMGVAGMTSVCTGVAETPPGSNRMAGTPPWVEKI